MYRAGAAGNPTSGNQGPQEEPKNSGSGAGGLIVFLVVALAGGAALYYFKFKKPRADTKGSDDLDEYDFGDDEDLEDEASETKDAPQNE